MDTAVYSIRTLNNPISIRFHLWFRDYTHIHIIIQPGFACSYMPFGMQYRKYILLFAYTLVYHLLRAQLNSVVLPQYNRREHCFIYSVIPMCGWLWVIGALCGSCCVCVFYAIYVRLREFGVSDLIQFHKDWVCALCVFDDIRRLGLVCCSNRIAYLISAVRKCSAWWWLVWKCGRWPVCEYQHRYGV